MAELTSLTKFNVSNNKKRIQLLDMQSNPKLHTWPFIGKLILPTFPFLQEGYLEDSCLKSVFRQLNSEEPVFGKLHPEFEIRESKGNESDVHCSHSTGQGCAMWFLRVRHEELRCYALDAGSGPRVGPTSPSSSFSASGALTYDGIVKATDNFSDSRCIGKGGQGVVYRTLLTTFTFHHSI